MITKKAKRIRKLLDKSLENRLDIVIQSQYSTLLINELIDNCKPTRDEFQMITDHAVLTGGSLYGLVMNAKDNWK